MVSTIICPRCKTKNKKTAEICSNCKNPLKTNKKPDKKNFLIFNPESRFDFKIILIGIFLFVICNVLLLNVVYDYAMLVSGFAIMLFLYILFKYYSSQDDSASMKKIGYKVILYYLIIVFVGAVILLTFNLF
ncbi:MULTISPECIES: zinc ribbon domain-containing protein [Methanobacterium]|uniref:Zinc ribbon domain-containing protein n=1 Tax=Methanobacterium subterraneum TaxID=59277 RepID=A0A2H4VAL0_9EURY|nr:MULTISPECIES: zinc ribbon domain-containing protein [Methanobacterium]MBW4256480.1 zinc ribbon domain-containing protein [Methanobacterium sp. YSL]PKL72903.1 MAG: zinc ribbon domain-containing protein [Methanobacteriales archaeon HGW-Methanobacteriales-2]AUB55123.1 zinc ribbon domain-containing protein [Methanobacterium subterraneum]AUB57891.1 zinc ribbon domain-containing protein [Methanobacterium sp. MZ-A1]AUB61026.1 zinc ribbon domain-containing protein [Methanobacterium subterraneum]